MPREDLREAGLDPRLDVLDLRPEVVSVEALVALKALLARITFVVQNRVDPDRVGTMLDAYAESRELLAQLRDAFREWRAAA